MLAETTNPSLWAEGLAILTLAGSLLLAIIRVIKHLETQAGKHNDQLDATMATVERVIEKFAPISGGIIQQHSLERTTPMAPENQIVPMPMPGFDEANQMPSPPMDYTINR